MVLGWHSILHPGLSPSQGYIDSAHIGIGDRTAQYVSSGFRFLSLATDVLLLYDSVLLNDVLAPIIYLA